MWESGNNGGIVAVGRILTDPADMLEDPADRQFDRNSASLTGIKKRVRIRLERVLPRPLAREILEADPALENFSFLKAPQGTNFKMTIAEAEAMEKLIANVAQKPVESPANGRGR